MDFDDSVEAVEKILKYSFVNKNLLKEALTQRSSNCVELSLPSFERLEFLGDSVLELAFTNYLHLTYPKLKLKELRELRTANVSSERFARVAVNHKLHQFAIRENPDPSVTKRIREFSEAVSKGDELVPYGGLVKAPKFLGDLVEAIAGAVYTDVNFNLERLWQTIGFLFEPICTPDDIRQQSQAPFLMLLRLAEKQGKQIDFRYSKDKNKKFLAEVYLDDIFIASGSAKRMDTAKLLATNKALQKLSECMPTEKVIDEDNLDVQVEVEVEKGKLFETCSTEKLQTQSGSSSLSPTSENHLSYERTPHKTVINEDTPHVEPDDVKRKLFQICSTEKRQLLQTGSSSSPVNYKITPIKMVIDEGSSHVEPADVKGKLIEICSTRKIQIQNGVSSFPMASEMTQEQMVIDEDSPHRELENVKRKLFEIFSKAKLQLQNGSSSLPNASENPLAYEMTREQVVDEDSPQLEPEDVKGKLFEICSTKTLQIQTETSSLHTVSANPLTDEMTIEQMVVDESSQDAGADNAKSKLITICAKNKWPTPIFSVEEEREPKNEQKFVCLVKIEIPSVEGTFHMKGDAKISKKQAEYSSAYHMIRALKSSVMSRVISNQQVPESLDENIILRSKKRRR